MTWPSADTAVAPSHVRLGAERGSRRPFDVHTDELSTNVFVPGATGTGKMTTLMALANGALANGLGILMVNCKCQATLQRRAGTLARRWSAPFLSVHPDNPGSMGYNPCIADGPTVANKIAGAFTYAPSLRSSSTRRWR